MTLGDRPYRCSTHPLPLPVPTCTTAPRSLAVRIAHVLLDEEAVHVRPTDPFTWSSGWVTPVYCDNRVLLDAPAARARIQEGFVACCATQDELPRVVAGTATAGIPHATLLADRLHTGLAYVRGSAKSHGRRRQVEGRVTANDTVLIVEDLVSTGGSALDAVQGVRRTGASVQGVLAIFSYDFPTARTAFADAHCSLHALTTFETLAQVARDTGRLSSAAYDDVMRWHRAPDDWTPAN